MTEDRKKDRKGFTLAELLIVVAIIGVLVAISIPILNKQLEKSREAHDIYTMRACADFAVDLYYTGKVNEKEAKNIGLTWWPNSDPDRSNAAGAYDPSTGKIIPLKQKKGYGKGTETDGGTKYSMGNSNGAYKAGEDYTNAVCMVAIYPNGDKAHIDVYWKNVESAGNAYVGGPDGANMPKYSIRIPLN